MVDTREAVIASTITSGAVAGTYLAAENIFQGQPGAIAISVFSSSFTLGYLGMKQILPF